MQRSAAGSRWHRLDRRRILKGGVLLVAGIVWLAVLLPQVPSVTAQGVRNEIGYAELTSVVTRFSVNTTALGYAPSSLAVPTDRSITLTIHNLDANATHTFTVYAKANTTIPTNTTPEALDALFAPANSSLVNVSLAPGAWANWTYNFSQPASYEFLSLVPYQFQAGFYGFLNASSGAGSIYSLNTSAYDSLRFIPSTLVAPPGATVVFHVTDRGTVHTFTIDSISNDTNLTVGQALPTTDPGLQNPLVDLHLSTTGTTYTSAPVTFPKHGVFWFVCTIPGHFQAGMYGFLYVGSTPTPPTTIPTQVNVLQVGIIAVSAVILGVAAFVLLAGMGERVRVPPPRRS